MQKRYFWAIQEISREQSLVSRFRTEREREEFISQDRTTFGPLLATDPEVRRIQRRMAGGERIEFPVEVRVE